MKEDLRLWQGRTETLFDTITAAPLLGKDLNWRMLTQGRVSVASTNQACQTPYPRSRNAIASSTSISRAAS